MILNKKVVLVSVGISRVEHPQFFGIMPMTSVGLHYIAEILRQVGYLVSIVNQTNEGLSDEIVVEKINMLQPDFVFFSQFFSTRERIKKILSGIYSDPIIIIGGHDATFHSQRLNKKELAEKYFGVDYIWQGEAEIDLISQLSLMKKQKSPMVIGGARMMDLDNLPILKHNDYDGEVGFLSTSRGCFQKGCSICTTPAFYPEGWRARSVEHVALEIKNLKKAGKKFVFICDDNFLGFADEHLERGYEIILKCKIAGLKIMLMTIKEQILRAHEKQYLPIWQGTVFRCFVGIESGGKHVGDKIGKITDINQHAKNSRRTIEVLYVNGIALLAGWINFKPDSTFSELEEDARFLFENGAECANFINLCQALRLYDGTKVYEKHKWRNPRVINGEFDYDFDDIRIGNLYRFLMFKVKDRIIDQLGGLIYEITDLIYLNQLQNTDLGIKYWQLRNEVNQINYDFFTKCLMAFRDGRGEEYARKQDMKAFIENARWYIESLEYVRAKI